MLLLTSFFVDILLPEQDGNQSSKFYNNFLSQYTSITVTALVSQSTFLHDTYVDTSKKDLDKDINNMINSIPDGAEHKRKIYKVLCMGAHIDPGKTLQEEEKRSFISDLFIQDSKKYNMSNREMIIKGLNTSAFLNYFFLLEDSLKNIYIEVNMISDDNFQLKGSEVISKALKHILEKKSIQNDFFLELEKRSKFFINYQSLNRTWKLLNFIRNRLIHDNGYYDEKAKILFKTYYENILKTYTNESESLTITLFIDKIDKYQKQIGENNYLIVDDVLENIIRNF
jgi:hypothetical protein